MFKNTNERILSQNPELKDQVKEFVDYFTAFCIDKIGNNFFPGRERELIHIFAFFVDFKLAKKD